MVHVKKSANSSYFPPIFMLWDRCPQLCVSSPSFCTWCSSVVFEREAREYLFCSFTHSEHSLHKLRRPMNTNARTHRYCKNKWHLQRHPGPLVMNKMLYEMTLCMVLIAQSISDSMPGQQDLCHGVMSRRFSAWVRTVQFTFNTIEHTHTIEHPGTSILSAGK